MIKSHLKTVKKTVENKELQENLSGEYVFVETKEDSMRKEEGLQLETCLSTGNNHQNFPFQGDKEEALGKPDKEEILVITISDTAREETRERKPEPSVQSGEQMEQEESKKMRPWLEQLSDCRRNSFLEPNRRTRPEVVVLSDNEEDVLDQGTQLELKEMSLGNSIYTSDGKRVDATTVIDSQNHDIRAEGNQESDGVESTLIHIKEDIVRIIVLNAIGQSDPTPRVNSFVARSLIDLTWSDPPNDGGCAEVEEIVSTATANTEPAVDVLRSFPWDRGKFGLDILDAQKIDEFAQRKDQRNPQFDEMIKKDKGLVKQKNATGKGPCTETMGTKGEWKSKDCESHGADFYNPQQEPDSPTMWEVRMKCRISL